MYFDTSSTESCFEGLSVEDVLNDLAVRSELGIWPGARAPAWATCVAEKMNGHQAYIEIVALRWAVNQMYVPKLILDG